MSGNAAYVLLAVLALCGCTRNDDAIIERPGEAPVSRIESDDAEMNEATRRARVSLDEFEQRLAHPPAGQSYISLKGRFEGNGVTEHIWLNDVTIIPGGYRGKIGNAPVNLPDIVYGQSVDLPRERVSDWLAIEDDTLIAGYTLRVVRARLSPDERARFDENSEFKIED